MVWFRNC